MANDVLMAPGAFDADAEQIRRRMAYAQMLQQQSQQQPQGQMVSGHYVAPSWTQHAANLLRAYAGRKGEDQALSDYRGLADQRRTEGAADVQKMAALLRGTPERTVNQPVIDDSEDPQLTQVTKPATGPDLAGALAMAGQSRNQMVQGVAPSLLGAMMPKAAKWEKAELPNADGSKRVGYVDINSPNPLATFTAGGTAPVKNEYVNGQAVQPFTNQPVGAPVPLQERTIVGAPGSTIIKPNGETTTIPNPNKPFHPDGTPNQDYQDWELKNSGAKKPVISVDARNYSTQENKQNETYGKTLGEIRGAITQAGWDAPGKLAQLSRMDELLKGVDGGGASPTIAQVASLANSFGIKLDPKLGVKQAAEALAREMAGSLRKPGTGPMTDKDFDNFLAQVPSLSKTAEGRAQITKTMRAAIERDQRAAAFARDYAQKNRGVIDDGFFDAMAKFYADSPIVMPQMPETNQQGAAMVMPKGFRVIRKGE